VANLEQARRLQERLVCAHPGVPEYRKGLFSIEQNLGWLRDRNQFLLLTHTSVQQELGLSPEQVQPVKDLAQRRREVFHDHHPEKCHAQLGELAGQEKALLRGLKPEQAQRLNQIAWQQSGPAAFAIPEVIEALHLTSRQKDKIRALQREAHWPKPPPGHRPYGFRPDGKKKSEGSETSVLDRILNVLTQEQKETWKALIGAPFKGVIHLGYRHGPEFGPPRYPKRS
jgi:hypothetical protein